MPGSEGIPVLDSRSNSSEVRDGVGKQPACSSSAELVSEDQSAGPSTALDVGRASSLHRALHSGPMDNASNLSIGTVE